MTSEHDTHLILLPNRIEYQAFHGPTGTDSEFQSHVEDGRSKCVTVGIAVINNLTGTLGTENCRRRHEYGGNKTRTCLRKRKCPSMNKNNETRRWLPIDVEGVRLATPGVVEQGSNREERGGRCVARPGLPAVIKYKSVVQGWQDRINKAKLASVVT